MSWHRRCGPLLASEGGEYDYSGYDGYAYEYEGGYTEGYAEASGNGGSKDASQSTKDSKPKRSKSKKKKKEVKPPPGKSRSGYN